jgi:hypothetical protein
MSRNPPFPQTRKSLNPDAKAAPLFDYMPQMSLKPALVATEPSPEPVAEKAPPA